MGWGLKVGLFFVALALAAFGGWIIAIPVFVLLFLPPILNRRGRERRGQKESFDRKRGPSVLSIVGALLILLSMVALASGGTLSPVVFAACGFALLLRGRISFPASTWVSPVKDSILLRHKLAPYRWSVLTEAKVSTRDLEGAMSGVNERLVFTSNPKPRLFLVFTTNSFGRAGAESALINRIQRLARSLVPSGVYLLPLNSVLAAEIATIRAPKVETETNNIRQNISSSDCSTLVVEAQHGFVERFDLYAQPGEGSKGSSILSPLKTASTGQLTLRELLHEARDKLGVPHPDRYSAFLSSMAATEGEALGQRITETVVGGQEQLLLVSSVGNPPVELSRAQLWAVSRVYE